MIISNRFNFLQNSTSFIKKQTKTKLFLCKKDIITQKYIQVINSNKFFRLSFFQ